MDTVPVERDLVAIRIDEKLQHCSDASSEPSIFKVPEQLSNTNAAAYEPLIISIGPHHRGKPRLGAMEVRKIRFFKQVLNRNGDRNSDRYVTAMRKLEESARKCYADNIELESEKFVEMMVFDSCFIVEFFLEWGTRSEFECPEQFLISRDLTLLENQLPFFIVREFLNLSKLGRYEDFIDRFLKCLPYCTGGACTNVSSNGIVLESPEHLLHIYYQYWRLFFPPEAFKTAGSSSTENIKSVTELEVAGVQFKRANRFLFHVSFTTGIMVIPTFVVDERMETLLRNLIAYEQCFPDREGRYIMDYMLLLNCLMKTSKDVEILCQRGIVINHLGNHGEVAALINKMCNNVTSGRMSTYSAVFETVNIHCKRKRNKWMAKWKLLSRRWMAALWNNYFNTPWAFISFLAAVFLLFLTFAQTILAYLSFKEHA